MITKIQVRICFILQFKQEKQPSPALSVDQSRFTATHFKNLNHNNAVAEATSVSPFNLEIGQFSLDLKILLPQKVLLQNILLGKPFCPGQETQLVVFLLN